MPGAICVPVTDNEAGNRALMPSLDLLQYYRQAVCHSLHAFAGNLNFDGLDGHRLGKEDRAI